MNFEQMTGAQIDTLIALVERGPLEDGSVPSKCGRNDLIDAGLAVRVIINGEDGFTAATYAGREVYLAHYEADTIREGMAMRRARNAVTKARHTSRGGR